MAASLSPCSSRARRDAESASNCAALTERRIFACGERTDDGVKFSQVFVNSWVQTARRSSSSNSRGDVPGYRRSRAAIARENPRLEVREDLYLALARSGRRVIEVGVVPPMRLHRPDLLPLHASSLMHGAATHEMNCEKCARGTPTP